MGQIIDVNTDGLIKYSKKLDKLSKTALPRVVRNTLNTVAFDVKKRTLVEESTNSFINRKKTFFKKFSKVNPAKQAKINDMKAVVGMIDAGEQAHRNMKQQQLGGKIKGRTLIPLDQARVGGKNNRNVRGINRVGRIKTVLSSRNSRGSKPRDKFIRAAALAINRYGQSAVIKHTNRGQTKFYRVSRGGSDIQTRQFNIKVTPLYSVKKGRSVTIKNPVPFVQNAAVRSQKGVRKLFITNAKKRIRRL